MDKKQHSKLALAAMQRAAIKAVERAASFNLDIPEWRDGQIVFVNAREKLKTLKKHSS